MARMQREGDVWFVFFCEDWPIDCVVMCFSQIYGSAEKKGVYD